MGHCSLRASRPPSAALTPTLSLAVLLGAAAAGAGDLGLLPDVALHLEGARCAPADTEAAWTTWVGAGLGLVSVRRATAYVGGDVETMLGSERRPFEAKQANYHLEAGLRLPVAALYLVPFFHHVSRHRIDRPKLLEDNWNVLGVRVAGALPASFPWPTRYALGIGRAIRWNYVAYEWELTARVEAGVWRRSWGEVYLRAVARGVSTKRTALQRDGFLDVQAEGGLRLSRGLRRLDLFAAYEHRNDIFVLTPGSRDRALLGLRLASSPELYLDPVWP